jgi:hypothetical protein
MSTPAKSTAVNTHQNNDEQHAEPSDAPPSYSEAIRPAAAGTPGPASTYHSGPQSSNEVSIQFPVSFNIYSQGLSSTWTLAEHQDHPVYRVVLHSGFSGSPGLVLLGGPQKSAPPMASVDFHVFSSRMTITLPALPGQNPTQGAQEQLVNSRRGIQRTYPFSIEVDLATGKREAYEWRYSGGDAVTSLNANHFGWKLVRMAGGPPPGVESEGGGKFVPGGFTTSDAKEIVAAAAETTLKGAKIGRFMFMGTGQSGLLGQRWALMAVITGLGLLEADRRSDRARS